MHENDLKFNFKKFTKQFVIVALILILYPLGGLLYLAGFTNSVFLSVFLSFFAIFSLPNFLTLFEIIVFLYIILKLINSHKFANRKDYLQRLAFIILLAAALSISTLFHKPYWVSYAHGLRSRLIHRTELQKELPAIRQWYSQFKPNQQIPLEICPAVIKNLKCRYVERGYVWKDDGSGDKVEVLVIGLRGSLINIGPENMQIPKSTQFLCILPFAKGAYITCGLRG